MSVGEGKSHRRLSIRANSRVEPLMQARQKLSGVWEARVITLFPDAFPGVLGTSLVGKALDQGHWALSTIDLRRFGEGKHRKVDDTPAGGGAGLVLRADVLDKALVHALQGTPDRDAWPAIYLSPRGRPFDQAHARRLARGDGVTLLCGRFEGVDQRVLDHHAIEEVSIGDFVLTGGEIAAQAIIDASVRLRPGILGNSSSIEEESFAQGLLEYPQYTRPAIWRGREIPPVLTSGDHEAVARWRAEAAALLTKTRRPDLWARYLSKKT